MTASVFTVSHSLVGWLVSEGDRIAEVFSSRFWAQKGAEALAYERHAGTGQPAMVVMTYPQRRVLRGAPLWVVPPNRSQAERQPCIKLFGRDRDDTDVLLAELENRRSNGAVATAALAFFTRCLNAT